jgi:hypothetical protein
VEHLEERALLSPVNWINPNGGNWDVGSNWSTGRVPGGSDDAIINTAAAATITIQAGDTETAHSLTTASNDTLSIKGGSLTLNGRSSLGGAVSLTAGTLQLFGGGTASGAVSVAAGAELLIPGYSPSYDFLAGASLAGAGTVEVDGICDLAAGTNYNVSGTSKVNGELVLDGNAASMGTLTELGGDLSGSAKVTVSGLTTWKGGSMSGSGTTDAKGGLALGSQGATAGSGETLAGRTLINEGSATWYALDTLTQEESSTFENLANATLDIQGGAGWGYDYVAADGRGSFLNEGTLTLDAGTAMTRVQVYFTNTGSVQLNSGMLGLGASGAATGSLSVAKGATLQFGNNYNYEAYAFNPYATLSGAGTVNFGSGVTANFAAGSTYNITGTTIINTGSNDGANVVFASGNKPLAIGSLTIQSGVVNFSTGSTITLATLTQSAGTLTGSDHVVVTGPTTWTGGDMTGSGSTRAAGNLNLGLNDGGWHQERLGARTFINARAATWAGAGELDLDTGSTFINQLGSTFAEQAPDTVWTDIGVGHEPDGTFVNQGTFTIQSNGTAGLDAFFQNTGKVEIKSGTWQLVGMGASSGTFTVDAGATFKLNKYYAAGAINGPGTVIRIDGSNATPTAYTGGAIPVPNGPNFFAVTGNVTVGSMTMTGGYLIVYGTLTVTGPMLWDGGTIVGPGTILAKGGLTLGRSLGDQQALYGTTLVNASISATWYGQAEIGLYDGGTLVNRAGAILAIQGGGSSLNIDRSSTVLNGGTLTAAVGSGATYRIGSNPLVNTGTIAVISGTLDLQTGGESSGSFSAASGSALVFEHSQWDFNKGSSVGGAGTVEFSPDYWSTRFNAGSTYKVTGATVVTQQAVTFAAGSSVTSTGTLVLPSGGGVVDFSTGAPVTVAALHLQDGILTGSDTVTVSGPLTWTHGTMSGTGTTIAKGSLVIGATDNTDGGKYLTVRTFINAGSGTAQGLHALVQDYGSIFVNALGATLVLRNGVMWQDNGDNASVLKNDGAIKVDPGVGGTVTLYSYPGRSPFFSNDGSVTIASGTLVLDADGNSSDSFSVAAGATYTLGSSNTFRFGPS